MMNIQTSPQRVPQCSPQTSPHSAQSSATLLPEIKVKLSSKRLGENRCQVRFSATEPALRKNTRGHMLVDASLTLKEVVGIIKERVSLMSNHQLQHHADFYSIGQQSGRGGGYIFFEA